MRREIEGKDRERRWGRWSVGRERMREGDREGAEIHTGEEIEIHTGEEIEIGKGE